MLANVTKYPKVNTSKICNSQQLLRLLSELFLHIDLADDNSRVFQETAITFLFLMNFKILGLKEDMSRQQRTSGHPHDWDRGPQLSSTHSSAQPHGAPTDARISRLKIVKNHQRATKNASRTHTPAQHPSRLKARSRCFVNTNGRRRRLT